MQHFRIITLCFFVVFFSCKKTNTIDTNQLTISIPTQGNSWVINDIDQSSKVISDKGISNWTNEKHIIRTYFYVDTPMTIPFGIQAKGESNIKVTFGSEEKNITISSSNTERSYIGEYKASTKGYHYIDIQGIDKQNNTFAEIEHLLFSNSVDTLNLKYIKDDFYFGRRGPSTHLVFETPTDDIEWLYSEIEIDKDQDVIGSYFMANGFSEGYFGIQVNSETERRILFSIWSPFKTDDPKSIPEDQKIKLLKKGEGVTTGEFGNEGSGGQSYKVFNWKAETRYGFLTRVQPNNDNSTNYTSYFFDPETKVWHLIASFKRPKTNTYASRPYSFLENFIPSTGVLVRKGGFYNQWMRDSNGKWYEITEAKFSADATARKDARLDYSGGTTNDGFYLMNCGFTNDHTTIGIQLLRTTLDNPPSIDFEKLE